MQSDLASVVVPAPPSPKRIRADVPLPGQSVSIAAPGPLLPPPRPKPQIIVQLEDDESIALVSAGHSSSLHALQNEQAAARAHIAEFVLLIHFPLFPSITRSYFCLADWNRKSRH
jgi:hypothetical protein